MKVLFTYYPAFVQYNHGAALLSALCQQVGIFTCIVPLGDNFLEKVEAFQPDYICYSFVTVHDYQLALPFVRQTQAYANLCGGVFLRKGGIVDASLFDGVCTGEGENLPDFFLYGDKRVFQEKQYCENISDLPLPDYFGVRGNEFTRGFPFLEGKRIIPYAFSRGCPYACTFCEVRNLPQTLRIKQNFIHDLEYLQERFDPDMFYFMDELLPYYNAGWRKEFQNTTPFMSYIRGDIKESELDFLIDNGLKVCAFGVESGDEVYRNTVLRKGLTDEQLFKTVGRLQAKGVAAITFFMIGTPQETESIKEKTIHMSQTLPTMSVIWQYENLGGKVWDGQQQQ